MTSCSRNALPQPTAHRSVSQGEVQARDGLSLVNDLELGTSYVQDRGDVLVHEADRASEVARSDQVRLLQLVGRGIRGRGVRRALGCVADTGLVPRRSKIRSIVRSCGISRRCSLRLASWSGGRVAALPRVDGVRPRRSLGLAVVVARAVERPASYEAISPRSRHPRSTRDLATLAPL